MSRQIGQVGDVGQHSMIFTANPPRAVSLYLVIMSAPVSRIVLMTWSRLTSWLWPKLPMPAARFSK